MKNKSVPVPGTYQWYLANSRGGRPEVGKEWDESPGEDDWKDYNRKIGATKKPSTEPKASTKQTQLLVRLYGIIKDNDPQADIKEVVKKHLVSNSLSIGLAGDLIKYKSDSDKLREILKIKKN